MNMKYNTFILCGYDGNFLWIDKTNITWIGSYWSKLLRSFIMDDLNVGWAFEAKHFGVFDAGGSVIKGVTIGSMVSSSFRSGAIAAFAHILRSHH